MENIIVISILVAIVAASITCLILQKKKGAVCVGCPYAKKCGAGCCGCLKEQ